MKLTLLLAGGHREIVEIVLEKGQDENEAFSVVVETWAHGLICDDGVHLLNFKQYPGGEQLILTPQMVGGMSRKVEVLQ